MSDHPRDLPPAADALRVELVAFADVPAFTVDVERLDRLAREMSARLRRRVTPEDAFGHVVDFARERREELRVLVRAMGSADAPHVVHAMLLLAFARKEDLFAEVARKGRS